MNTNKSLTHWKKLQNPNFLGSFSLLPNEEKVLTIKNVAIEMVTGTNNRKEECAVMHFIESELPMILNVTNSKTIEKLTGTPYIEQWAGHKIQIYAAEIYAFGEDMQALRIRSKAPQESNQKPILDSNYKGWDMAIAAFANGETDMEFLKENYNVPIEAEQLLLEAVQNA